MAPSALFSTTLAAVLFLCMETEFQFVKCDCPPITVGHKDFPDIFNLEKGQITYVLGMEVTLHDLQSTFSVMEYYQWIDRKGKLEVIDPINGKTTFVYFRESTEAFTIQGKVCTTSPVAATQFFDGLEVDLWRLITSKELILGPSAIFRQAFLSTEKNKPGFTANGTGKVGDRLADVWTQCIEDGPLKMDIKYYFAADFTGEVPGLTAMPLRVEIAGTNSESSRKSFLETYDVFVYQSSFPPNMPNPIRIPVGVGCKPQENSLAYLCTDDWIPSLQNSDLRIQAEVIFKSHRNEDINTYVNNFEVTNDASSRHLAYTYTPWYQRKDDKDKPVVEFADSMSIVVDALNHYVYQIDRKESLCEVIKYDQFRPSINFPDGTQLDFMEGDILIRNEGFVCLGKGEERGLPVRIYEMKSDTFKFSPNDKHDRTVITRYYLDEGQTYMTGYGETKIPMKVEIRTFNITRKGEDEIVTVDREVTFNLFGFTKYLPNKNELFDVRNCFPKPDDARWFQMTFYAPVPDDSFAKTWNRLEPEIEANFFHTIGIVGQLSPLRMPVALVDFDPPNIIVTALLLDRPKYIMDFKLKGNYEMKSEQITKRAGLTTLDQCAQSCLEDHQLIGSCMAFSYCGASCYLAHEDVEATDLINNTQCKYHSRVVINGPNTLDDAARLISANVQNGILTLQFPYTNSKYHSQVMDAAAIAYVDRIAEGINGLHNKDEGLERRFYTAKESYGFNPYASKDIISGGTRSLYECKVACLNSLNCESLSYCVQDSQCLLSSLFGEEIDDTALRASTQCSIMSRNYIDSFNELPEMTYAIAATKAVAVKNREDCAKACLKETSFKCLSFDSCPTATDPMRQCLLHSLHYLDMKDSPSNVTHNPVCDHFSRKYIYDFKQINNKQLQVGSNAVIQFTGLTAEECAKQCIDTADYGCLSFDFCKGSPIDTKDNTCNLVGKRQSDVTLVTSTVCTYFDREGLVPDQSKRYSSGLAGGLGFLFLVIGSAFGAVAAFGFSYMRSK